MGHRELKKTETQNGTGLAFLAIGVIAILGSFMMGCQSSLPLASVETVNNPCPGPTTFESCQSLTANGTWNSSCATSCTSVLALSPYYAVDGKYSLDAAITSLAPIAGGGYDNAWLTLSNFAPVSWRNYPQMIINMTVDQSVVAGATYSNLVIIGSTGAPGQYYSTMSTNTPIIVSGFQSVTMDIDLNNASSEVPPTQDTLINMLYFAYSRSAPTGSQGTGNIYVGDIILNQNCP